MNEKSICKKNNGVCVSPLLLPAADSKSDYVELTCSSSLPVLTEELCADR